MEYRFREDPLFGKYCYIDTPWIAGKKTIYRIVNSGVRSNGWIEVPLGGREEVVLHDYQEDVVFVVLDTLITEDSKIKRVALKDIVLADTPQMKRQRLEGKRWTDALTTEEQKCLLDAYDIGMTPLTDCGWGNPDE